jgi:hypothetical protein
MSDYFEARQYGLVTSAYELAKQRREDFHAGLPKSVLLDPSSRAGQIFEIRQRALSLMSRMSQSKAIGDSSFFSEAIKELSRLESELMRLKSSSDSSDDLIWVELHELILRTIDIGRKSIRGETWLPVAWESLRILNSSDGMRKVTTVSERDFSRLEVGKRITDNDRELMKGVTTFCAQCGAQVRSGAAFCVRCGHRH